MDSGLVIDLGPALPMDDEKVQRGLDKLEEEEEEGDEWAPVQQSTPRSKRHPWTGEVAEPSVGDLLGRRRPISGRFAAADRKKIADTIGMGHPPPPAKNLASTLSKLQGSSDANNARGARGSTSEALLKLQGLDSKSVARTPPKAEDETKRSSRRHSRRNSHRRSMEVSTGADMFKSLYDESSTSESRAALEDSASRNNRRSARRDNVFDEWKKRLSVMEAEAKADQSSVDQGNATSSSTSPPATTATPESSAPPTSPKKKLRPLSLCGDSSILDESPPRRASRIVTEPVQVSPPNVETQRSTSSVLPLRKNSSSSSNRRKSSLSYRSSLVVETSLNAQEAKEAEEKRRLEDSARELRIAADSPSRGRNEEAMRNAAELLLKNSKLTESNTKLKRQIEQLNRQTAEFHETMRREATARVTAMARFEAKTAAEAAAMKDAAASLRREVFTARTQLVSARRETSFLKEELMVKSTELDEAHHVNEGLADDVNGWRERFSALESKHVRMASDFFTLAKALEREKKAHTETKAALQTAEKTRDELRTELADLRVAMSRAADAHTADIASLQAHVDKQITDIKRDLAMDVNSVDKVKAPTLDVSDKVATKATLLGAVNSAAKPADKGVPRNKEAPGNKEAHVDKVTSADKVSPRNKVTPPPPKASTTKTPPAKAPAKVPTKTPPTKTPTSIKKPVRVPGQTPAKAHQVPAVPTPPPVMTTPKLGTSSRFSPLPSPSASSTTTESTATPDGRSASPLPGTTPRQGTARAQAPAPSDAMPTETEPKVDMHDMQTPRPARIQTPGTVLPTPAPVRPSRPAPISASNAMKVEELGDNSTSPLLGTEPVVRSPGSSSWSSFDSAHGSSHCVSSGLSSTGTSFDTDYAFSDNRKGHAFMAPSPQLDGLREEEEQQLEVPPQLTAQPPSHSPHDSDMLTPKTSHFTHAAGGLADAQPIDTDLESGGPCDGSFSFGGDKASHVVLDSEHGTDHLSTTAYDDSTLSRNLSTSTEASSLHTPVVKEEELGHIRSYSFQTDWHFPPADKVNTSPRSHAARQSIFFGYNFEQPLPALPLSDDILPECFAGGLELDESYDELSELRASHSQTGVLGDPVEHWVSPNPQMPSNGASLLHSLKGLAGKWANFGKDFAHLAAPSTPHMPGSLRMSSLGAGATRTRLLRPGEQARPFASPVDVLDFTMASHDPASGPIVRV